MSNNPEDKNLNTLLDDIKQELLSYINRRLKLLKLESYEKLSKSASYMGYGLIVLVTLSFIIFFVLMGMAFLVGELLGSLAKGFGVMALFSLLILTIVFLLRKPIMKAILYKSINFFRKVESDEE
ncbi:multidrug efflux pump subunit AcrB [Dysgonomonas hofstadii]|uniref:Multidrug efflux pump subunit AcrB n=1 Tax=Dysgonomonas hofstadii TaxID=637886 RepID=A0A840CW50_9BACT|nr:phage holin family protein [Dysgonomonas hofstadii]MBB4036702.1 multidrug efflux pump subunit AcrB [Dysgonomonas hofstadii]